MDDGFFDDGDGSRGWWSRGGHRGLDTTNSSSLYSPTANVTRATRASPTHMTHEHSLHTSARQRCTSIFLVYFYDLECSLQLVQSKCDVIVLLSWTYGRTNVICNNFFDKLSELITISRNHWDDGVSLTLVPVPLYHITCHASVWCIPVNSCLSFTAEELDIHLTKTPTNLR